MTDTSSSFFPSASERRAFRDEVGRGIGRYIPPELRPLLGFVAESTPSAALERAGAASMEMVAPDRTAMERLGSLGTALSETAGVAAPVFAGRAIPSAEAAQELFMGVSAPVRSATETFFERMNQPGEMPERLMSGIDPLAAFRAAREAMLGARSDMPFEDLVDLSSQQAAARDAVVSSLSEAPSVRLFNRDGRAAVVGEGMGPGEDGKFRVTFFDADRRPTNHTVYETKEEALREALNAGFDSRTAAPASSGGQSPEEIMRSLREAVPEAEARLAEDMRIGNERIRAESLARMGEAPSITTPERYAEFLSQRGFTEDFQDLMLSTRAGDQFDAVRQIFDEDSDFALDVLRSVAGEGASPAQLASTRDQVTRLTQELLQDFPEEVTVYRAGRIVPGQPQSFTLNPNYNVSGNLPWREGSDSPLVAYTVNKSDILASPDITVRGPIGEGEVIIRGEDVSRPADRETAFTDLANMQRGGPELAMLRAQETMGGGVMNWAVEHIGDLTHRMAERGGVFGREYVAPKVRRAIDMLESGYGFNREFLENLDANQRARNARTGRDDFNVITQTNSALQRYADAHRQLPVYNEMQRAARDAAVSLGEQNFDETLRNLRIIQDALDDGTYEARAMEFPGQPTADRGPREFARGGEVMMRGDMSSQLSGGIGRFADDAKNMYRGPRGIERFAQYMQAGGEVGRGVGQGSTTGQPRSGSAADVYIGAEGDRLSDVRTRIIRESGVDPVKVAAEEGLDPNLFLNLIAQESGGRSTAESSAGAYGYTQLMDATARELGVDRTDPEQNLRGGARYLRQQIERFNNIPLALAAYNAGPNAVERFGGIPPYSETRNYVASILGLPGGEMAISPTMRPNPVQPVPRPDPNAPIINNPLTQFGERLANTPINEISAARQEEVNRNINAPIMPPQLGGFTDLMRNMP